MEPSNLLFDLLEHFEGCRLRAYQDGAGVWTIGYGTTYYPNGSHVKEGDTCTGIEAISYMRNALDHFVSHLNATVPAGLGQPKFDALYDFCYNAGQGAWDSSTLRKTVNGAEGEIAANFAAWDKMHVDGKLVESSGLLRRRKCEAYLYLNGVNHPTFYL